MIVYTIAYKAHSMAATSVWAYRAKKDALDEWCALLAELTTRYGAKPALISTGDGYEHRAWGRHAILQLKEHEI
jgi:hypothetical protein